MVNVCDHVEGSVALTFGPGVTQMVGTSSAGFTSVVVSNGLVFTPGMLVLIMDLASSEPVRVAAVSAGSVTIAAPGLVNTHSASQWVQVNVKAAGDGVPRSPYRLQGG